jgi:hypothetical protein
LTLNNKSRVVPEKQQSQANLQQQIIALNSYLYINNLNIETIQKVFIKYGHLNKDCFSVYVRSFADGTTQTMFEPPVGTSSTTAHKLINKICLQIKDIPLNILVNFD